MGDGEDKVPGYMPPDGLHPSLTFYVLSGLNFHLPPALKGRNMSASRPIGVKKDNTFCLALKGRNIELPSGYRLLSQTSPLA